MAHGGLVSLLAVKRRRAWNSSGRRLHKSWGACQWEAPCCLWQRQMTDRQNQQACPICFQDQHRRHCQRRQPVNSFFRKIREQGQTAPPAGVPHCCTGGLGTPRPHLPCRGPGCSRSSCSPWCSFWTPPPLSTPLPGQWRLEISPRRSCSYSL